MSRQRLFTAIAVVGLAIALIFGRILAQQKPAGTPAEERQHPGESSTAIAEDLRRRIESLEIRNDLVIRSMQAQLDEAATKARFFEITLTILGGFLGIIVAIITFSRLGHERWEREMQEKREDRESGIMDALKNNVDTVTSLMEIISEGQKVATFVKDTIEHQRLQSRPFQEEITNINGEAEKMLKEGHLKRRLVRQREIQGKINFLGKRIDKILMLTPLIPFEIGEGKLSAVALYVKSLQEFLDSNYFEAERHFKEVRHNGPTGDLLWQVPFYEGLAAKNEGNYSAAIQAFEEAIKERRLSDPELGPQTEIAEISYLRSARHPDAKEKQAGLIETRKRCLDIILKAEGIETGSHLGLEDIKVGTNPNMTDEHSRLQARCFLVSGNTYWAEKNFPAARLMYQKSLEIEKSRQTQLPDEYASVSLGQALDKLNRGVESIPYYEHAFSILNSRLGRYDEIVIRILRTSIFALCVKRLREAERVENTWQPLQYRIEAERIIGDELRFKNPKIKLFSPFSKLHLSQDEFIEELRNEIR